MGRGTLEDVRDGCGTLGLVRDKSGDPRVGPGWVGVHLGRSEMGRGTLRDVWDRSGDPSERSGAGRGTLG